MNHKSFNKLRKNSAVSEVIGTILLLGIAVSLFSIVYISVLSVPSSPPTPSANIICSIQGNTIVFEHFGGDSLDFSTSFIIESAQNRYETTLENLSLSYVWDKNGDEFWGFGEQLVLSAALLGQQSANILVKDPQSNSIIMMGTLPASNPLFTFINQLASPQTVNPVTITATSSGIEPENITLWYRWSGFFKDDFEEDDLLISMHNNMSFTGLDYVEVAQSGAGSDLLEYVNSQNVAVDGMADIGTHSDFSAQQQGADGVYDVLSESSSTNQITISSTWGADISETGHSYPSDGEDWVGESGSTSYRIVNLFSLSDLPQAAIVDGVDLIFSVLESGQNNHRLDVCPYDGDGQAYPQFDWPSVMYARCRDGTKYINDDSCCRTTGTKTLNLGGQAVIDLMQAKNDVNRFSIGFSEQGDNSDYCAIGEFSDSTYSPKLRISYSGGNYNLITQCSWENINYQTDNEELCIKTGTFDSESLIVDVWNASSLVWDENVLILQPNSWNNLSINKWLVDSTFTIRYRGADDSSDTTLDTWQIDVALLHLWQPSQVAIPKGDLTSTLITKPNDVGWQHFYVEVNNTINSSFSILDSEKHLLLSDLINGQNISNISENSVYLHGNFNSSVRLNSWKLTLEGENWQASSSIDEDGSNGWEWTNFNFKSVSHGFSLEYYFYSIAKKDGWLDESPPNPYDATCIYKP